MTDVVVSVGMGPGQLAFIKRLRELGYNVIAFGKGKNSEEAEKLCLYSAQLDTHRSKEVIEWIDSLNVNVIGVGSFAGGQAVHTVQVLSDYYNAPTKIPSELMVETSKEEQQKLLEKYHLSSIHTWKAKDLSVEMVKREANDDFIVKPANGRGSKGILFIDKEALKKRLDNHDFQEDDVIQVVKKGREYRCVFIIQNQKIKLLAPILRKFYRNTLFLGVLRYSEKDLNVIEKILILCRTFWKHINLLPHDIQKMMVLSHFLWMRLTSWKMHRPKKKPDSYCLSLLWSMRQSIMKIMLFIAKLRTEKNMCRMCLRL